MPVEKIFEVCIFLWERPSINIFLKNIGHNALNQILAFFFTKISKHELKPCERTHVTNECVMAIWVVKFKREGYKIQGIPIVTLYSY